jgi:thiol:disulfide interchange protein DsbC
MLKKAQWLLALLLMCGVAFADEASVQRQVAAKYPGAKIAHVIKTPYNGLYEVYMDGNILYTDEKVSFVVVGTIIDTRTNRNVTLQRLRKLTAIDIKQIPLELGIRKVKGNGSRQLIVFSDPLCPFCQQLEQELLKIDNITLYIMLYPIEKQHPGATELSKAIWCSRDPAQAWDAWMQQKTKPSAKPECGGDPIAKLDQIGARLNFGFTPTLVFADGAVTAGMISAADLEKRLAETR